ncbi:MAG: CYTH domain-containing protein [Prevotella sp.]|nr:CYTH domain-containing protein [Prevotella sp.]
MSGLEIERKFLVRKDRNFREMASSSSRIKQGYIEARGATVRVRIRGDKGYLTIKGPSYDGGLSRYEFEKEITLNEAEHLMKLCVAPVIDKTRYLVPFEGHLFEVDEFYGDNDGLVTAEVELKSGDEPFAKPDFLGPEVTADRRFRNAALRENPFKLWREQIPPAYR